MRSLPEFPWLCPHCRSDRFEYRRTTGPCSGWCATTRFAMFLCLDCGAVQEVLL